MIRHWSELRGPWYSPKPPYVAYGAWGAIHWGWLCLCSQKLPVLSSLPATCWLLAPFQKLCVSPAWAECSFFNLDFQSTARKIKTELKKKPTQNTTAKEQWHKTASLCLLHSYSWVFLHAHFWGKIQKNPNFVPHVGLGHLPESQFARYWKSVCLQDQVNFCLERHLEMGMWQKWGFKCLATSVAMPRIKDMIRKNFSQRTNAFTEVTNLEIRLTQSGGDSVTCVLCQLKVKYFIG